MCTDISQPAQQLFSATPPFKTVVPPAANSNSSARCIFRGLTPVLTPKVIGSLHKPIVEEREQFLPIEHSAPPETVTGPPETVTAPPETATAPLKLPRHPLKLSRHHLKLSRHQLKLSRHDLKSLKFLLLPRKKHRRPTMPPGAS